MKSGSDLSVFEAALFEKDVAAALLRQKVINSSQDVFSSLQDASEETEHLAGTLHGQKTRGKMGESYGLKKQPRAVEQ